MEKLTSGTLFGNWATLLLATGKDGTLDFSKLGDEIDVLTATSPNGIYSNGTACEFYSQSLDEFVRISELLADKCRKSGTKFQIGVSHPCAQESLARLRSIKSLEPCSDSPFLPGFCSMTFLPILAKSRTFPCQTRNLLSHFC